MDHDNQPFESGPSTGEMEGSAATQPAVHSVFFGKGGLRPGWRLLFYLLAFMALLVGLSLMFRGFAGPRRHRVPSPLAELVGECISLIAAIIPALVAARLERLPFGGYGLPKTGAFGKPFWTGALWGISAITILLLVMRGVGVFNFGGLAIHGVRVLKFGLFWAFLFLVVGLFEEFLARGYTQFTLTKIIGFWPAALILSVAFGAVHFPQEYALGDKWAAWSGVLGVVFIAMFFCLTLRRTGTLWFAVGMHAAWDWGESFLYSVPDSGTQTPGHLLRSSFHGQDWLTGGPVGPEASVLVFVVIAALFIVFHFAYPEVKYGRTVQAPATESLSTA